MVDEERSVVFVFGCLLFSKMSKPFYGVFSQPRISVPRKEMFRAYYGSQSESSQYHL